MKLLCQDPQVSLVNAKILLFLLALVMEQYILSRREAKFEDILLQQLDVLRRLYLVVVHKSTISRSKVHNIELNSPEKIIYQEKQEELKKLLRSAPALCAIRSGEGYKAELKSGMLLAARVKQLMNI